MRWEGAAKESACCLWALSPWSSSQQRPTSPSIQNHTLQLIVRSAAAGRWMCWAPQHHLLYFCTAQHLDTEREIVKCFQNDRCVFWWVFFFFFLLRLLNLSCFPKKHLGDRKKIYLVITNTKKKKFINLLPIEQKPETQKLCLLQQIYPLLIKQLQPVLSSV